MISTAARITLGLVFAAAAWPKLLHPEEFSESIAYYQVISYDVSAIVARLLPALEAVVALALILGFSVRGAAALCIGMLVVFEVAMAQAVLRGIDLSCGCFGAEESAGIGWTNFARNIVLIAVATLVLVLPNWTWSDLTGSLKGNTLIKT